MILENLGKYRNSGLLLMRIGLGVAFMLHGFPKLAGGTEMWTSVGHGMKVLGIDFMPQVWGFLAACAETFGGFLLLIGLAFRPACIVIAFTMAVAAANHLAAGEGFNGAGHALELGVVLIGLLFIGPGKYSVDKK